ncbi:MAG: hydrolase [Gammaproteobacteria bacterium]|nr:hydrolase [Gammaproteobacteria bacterium]
MTIKQREFKPAWWAKGPHAQTILADFLTRRDKSLGHQQRLELPDGDFVDLVWTTPPPENYQGPLIVLFHGLEGSIKSHYASRLLTAIKKHHWLGVIMHFRGCSGEPNRLSRAYHSGETTDARYLLTHLKQRFPMCDLYGVGYSLGGNMLLKYLAKHQDDSLISAAVAISPPLDLSACQQRLKQGFSRVYQHHLLKRMKANLALKMQKVPQLVEHLLCGSDLSKITNFHQFDSLVTAPLHGFSSAQDYYQQCSALPDLKKIRTPSLILHAKDDPFMSEAVIPTKEQLSLFVEYQLTQHGGHVGFIEGKYPWRPQFYIEQRVTNFFQQMINR